MKFYIKEWSECLFSLMTDAGNVLGYFSSVDEAMAACEEWYKHYGDEVQFDVSIQSYKSNHSPMAVVY